MGKQRLIEDECAGRADHREREQDRGQPDVAPLYQKHSCHCCSPQHQERRKQWLLQCPVVRDCTQNRGEYRDDRERERVDSGIALSG
jgi:hypothetical protein